MSYGKTLNSKFTIDDFSQYAPMLAVYGLNLCGVKGRHSFTDRTIILATAYALMGITVNTFKMTASVERPDGSSRNSFPSGIPQPLLWVRSFCVRNIGTFLHG